MKDHGKSSLKFRHGKVDRDQIQRRQQHTFLHGKPCYGRIAHQIGMLENKTTYWKQQYREEKLIGRTSSYSEDKVHI